MIRIKKATYLSGYKIKLLFSDGKIKVVDFENWIFGKKNVYLEPLKEIEFFKKFELDEPKYTICWPNGADFCPDVLYKIGQEIKRPVRRSKKATSKKIRKTLSSRLKKAYRKANKDPGQREGMADWENI
ncbi:MAG: DUF2442 domain-containing protein [Verrucomicrobiota bacterium]|nr:DUF2442 domain-containing protein [Verrucomicrobiota bacterium]